MENWKKKLIKMLIYAGVGREEYNDIGDEIRQKNREMLTEATILCSALFFVLFVASYLIGTLAPNRLLYMITFLVLTAFFGVQHTLMNLKEVLILVCCYLLMIIVYGYAILVSALTQRGIPSTTFCVLLLMAAFFVIDRPYRVVLFQTVATIVFCITVHYRKEPPIAAMDTVNAVCFFMLGSVTAVYLLNTKIKGLLYNRNTQRELDTDGLTKLMIKKAVERDIRRYITSTREPGALIMIDLDNFKQVNDTKGHAYGDVVLKITGDCINSTFRASDIKGRFGGDEFIVFLPGMKSRKIITERLDHFKGLMEQGIAGEENRRGINQSIGIAMYPEDAEEYEKLFEKADKALYAAKKRGKNQYCFYTSVKIHSSEE